MIRVLLADDHPFVRRGVRQTIDESGVGTVIAEAGDGHEVLGLVRDLGDAVDVVITDLSMPSVGGLEVVSRLHAERPCLPVLVLSMHPTVAAGVQALEAGASGYLSKRDAPDHIVSALVRVHEGRRYLTADLAEALADRTLGGPAGTDLSVRELQVVQALARGLTRGETAARLGLAPTTVSAYKARAKEKVGASSDADLVRYAVDRGIARPGLPDTENGVVPGLHEETMSGR
jgi:DNA-binding NarL/FixJ family response regulator